MEGASKLVEKGEITEDEANSHPQSNILMGCLGTEEDPPMDVHYIPNLRAGDSLLCCSDGVWHYFSTNELGSVLSALTPRECTEFLIDKARTRARGTGDNLSLIVVKVETLGPDQVRAVDIPTISSLKAQQAGR